MLWKSFKTISICLLVGTLLIGVSPKVLADAKVQNVQNPPTKEIILPAILKRIAFCESGGRQFNADGTVLRGIVNPHDIGKWQINEVIWGAKARSLGFDIYTLEGNTQMALWIYDHYSTSPWFWSAGCWDR